jgi:acetylornithine deacetylase/succinyl-diaminopimelate desuccinylase-like protein
MRSAEAVSLPRLRCWHRRQIVALGWALQQPRAPVPASAPAQIFSAERAYADLQRIAGPEPTPIGSVGSDAIRDQLVAALSAAGFNVEVQTGVGSQTFESTTVAGRVDNVVASLAGQDSTGSVVLAAHYDSTFGTPGASDDKASVAAMLETARTLASGGPMRNDVVMIFTDGEEAGLLGASSFVAEHPLADRGGVVLNWEATGNAGPSVLFETSSGTRS